MIIRNGRHDNPVSNVEIYDDTPPEGTIVILKQDDDRVYIALEDLDDAIRALEHLKNEYSKKQT